MKRRKPIKVIVACLSLAIIFNFIPYMTFAAEDQASLSEEVLTENDSNNNVDNSSTVNEDENIVNDDSSTAKGNVRKKTTVKVAEDQDPSIKAYLYGEGGDAASKTTPARIRIYPYVYGAWPTSTAQLNIEYQNLEANATYTLSITSRYADNSATRSEKIYVASGSGSGTWVVDSVIDPYAWTNDVTGEARVSFAITDSNRETIIDYSVPEDDKSMTILVRGIASMEVLTSNGINRENLRFITKEELDEGGVISGRIKLRGLLPNTEYTISSVLSRFDLTNSMYSWGTDVSGTVSQTMKTDADGTVVFTPEYTDIDKEKIKEKYYYYTNRFTVRASDYYAADLTTYHFRPSQLVDPTSYIGLKDMLLIGEDNKPEEKPTLVNVQITNRLAGSKALLPGSKLKVVKGNGPDGEAVEDWVQTDKAHSLNLEPGTYTLVQLSAPNGYDLADPITFTLSANDAQSRGYNFEAGYGRTGTSFSIRKDRSDDEGEVVFCINHEKPFGERLDGGTRTLLYYSEYDIKDAQLNNVIGTPRVSLDELRTKLLQITYGGYPNDKLGLKEKYNLKDSELSQATQHAIHYYTDSFDFQKDIGTGIDRFISEATYNAYLELINTNITPPEGMTVKFYMPSNDIYQALISTYFRDEEPVVDVVIENDEPQTPKDKEKKITKHRTQKIAKQSPATAKVKAVATDDPFAKWIAISMIAALLMLGLLSIKSNTKEKRDTE